MSGAALARPTGAKDDPGNTQSHIDLSVDLERDLQLVYGICLAEEVPDRFVKLLARLRELDPKS